MLASKRVKLNYTILSVAYILLGLFMLLLPETALKFLTYILGAALVVLGLLRIALYFIKEDTEHVFRNDLAVGVVMLAMGIYLFTKPDNLLALLPLVLGLIVLYDSCINLQNSFDLKKAGMSLWWIFLLTSFITAVLGVLLIISPFAEDILRIFFAVVLVVNGAVNLLMLVLGMFNRKRLERALAQPPTPKEQPSDKEEAPTPHDTEPEPLEPLEVPTLTADDSFADPAQNSDESLGN